MVRETTFGERVAIKVREGLRSIPLVGLLITEPIPDSSAWTEKRAEQNIGEIGVNLLMASFSFEAPKGGGEGGSGTPEVGGGGGGGAEGGGTGGSGASTAGGSTSGGGAGGGKSHGNSSSASTKSGGNELAETSVGLGQKNTATPPEKNATPNPPNDVAKATPEPAPTKNLNSNDATSHFGLYEIRVDGELYKIGKADLDRITQSSGLPTRLHQQLRTLEKTYGKGHVSGEVVEDLGTTTTKEAKEAETARLQETYKQTGMVPEGNKKSFTP